MPSQRCSKNTCRKLWPGVAEGKKSLAISVRLQPFERTLTDAEIEAISRKIVDVAEKAAGQPLRGSRLVSGYGVRLTLPKQTFS